MSADIECLRTAIGLSQTDCDCYDPIEPGYSYSDSGIYLDQIEGFPIDTVKAVEDCADGSIWEIMTQARIEGIRQTKVDLMNYLSSITRRRRNFFKGIIGTDKYTRARVLTNTYAGLTFVHAPVRSGKMTITGVSGLFVANNADVTMTLYEQDSDTPVTSWTFPVVAKKVRDSLYTLPTPYEIDLDTQSAKQYWILFTVADEPQPMDSSVHCSCGEFKYVNHWKGLDSSYANLSLPRTQYNWLDWIVVAGTQGDTIADRLDWGTQLQNNGVYIQAEFTCKGDDIICSDSLDFENDEKALVLAYTIRYKAAEKVYQKILASPKLNRFTGLDRERIYGQINHCKKEYNDRIKFLGDQYARPENLNLTTDCFTCWDKNDMHVGKIRIT